MKQSKNELFKELIRFIIVGGFATLVDYAVFYVCNHFIFSSIDEKINIFISELLAFIISLLTNWFLQKFVYRYITTKQTRSKKVFMKFLILSVIGLGLSELGLLLASGLYNNPNFMFTIFGQTLDFWKVFMKVLMTAIVLVFNYLGRKYLVFNMDEYHKESTINEDKAIENNEENIEIEKQEN